MSFLIIDLFAALSRVIRWRRLKRNVFDPSLPAYPNPNAPFYQPPPYPVPATTMSPASALMPQPPKYHDYSADNPYLDTMNEPINPNFGLGFSSMQPTILGGSFNFPTGNLLRPQENVGGTFGIARPVHVRFGTQGGPFYPWQDKQYAKTINSIEDANVRREALRRDAESYYDRRASEQSITPYRDQPALPPKLPPSFRMFDLPPLPPASGR